MRLAISCVLAMGIGLAAGAARGEAEPAEVFGDHMVLQRAMPVPVWGKANPGEKVSVKFRTQEKTAEADAQGKWMVKLDPLEAGGPDVLTIGGKALQDVLVGEVWVGSGQSNMAVGTGGAAKEDPGMAKIAEGEYPTVRIGSARGKWRAATAKNNASLSALALAFAVKLQENLKVPVGVAIGCQGGSSTEFWLTREHLLADEACRAAMEKYTKEAYPALKTRWEAEVARWEKSPAATQPDKKPKPPAEAGASTNERHVVGHLYEREVRAMVGMAVRGVLWDQGENTAAIAGPGQVEVMNALIRGWRKDWGQDLAWVYVQKPSGAGCAWDANDPLNLKSRPFAPLPEKVPGLGDGKYNEYFLKEMETPNTAMALASDLSPGVHPPMKSAYGTRAARAALVLAYGQKIEIYGPLYASHQVEGAKIRVKFTHVGQGLSARHGEKLQGFMIAGEDRKFVWAEATIENDSVVVWSDQVAKPAAVRYAWSQQHPWANLFNKDGLPAQTFRTDEW